MTTVMVNVHEAKTQLSRLLADVAGGGDVVIARRGVPVARLVRYERLTRPAWGSLAVKADDEAFAAMGEDELEAWGLL
ncbi:MAG: type II toxin-antitoxin system prevent-host-death family antitoxin [Acidimicrobiia bacterium]|nr:type II toxin-antitoxin system prevent-host-death family antitoxin [Acidimicrobiia bacterium]MBA3982751.1 type II toxin-antitoxin system prevent-host-death family antitoxin [Acidimicrobiia bacterium]MDQ3389713.1 type II toxin-antitoxin system prevent-host-death family antitoxin [Actinomycetota bacterium]